MSKVKKFLVLANPRSGTLFASMAFEGIGLHVAHEIDEVHVKEQYGVETYYDGVVTGVFRNTDYDLSKYEVILHQVRNPLKAISSSYKCGGMLAVRTIRKFGDRILPRTVLERHMKAWIVFTDMADKVADYTYRVEYMKHEYKHICNELLGVPKPVKWRGMLRFNERRHYQHTWQDFQAANVELTKRIKEKAVQYGYTLKNLRK